MDNGCFPSTRRDGFPAGLRVLVVDDDLTWLRILEKMLKKCSYEVTTCCLATEALKKLREKKNGYDIVISDVNMPDMNGFKLLEYVGLEMDLPVIMMSVDGETSRVMKGVQHGACDYLLKPIRMKELRNIWQHVLRKRIHEAREFEGHEGFEGIHLMINGSDQSDEGSMFALEDISSSRKRKDLDNKHDDREFGDQSSTKKARVVWSVDLHQKFVQAVNQIGLDKVGPKKILDLMNVPWLTRENVASHLQKYRLYLSRLPKGKDRKSSKDPGSSSLQSPINKQQNEVAIDSFRCTDKTLQLQNMVATKGDSKGIVSEPETQKVRVDRPFAPHNSEGNHAVFDCTSQLPLHVDQSQSIASVNSNPSLTEDVPACSKTKPLYADYRSDCLSPKGSAVNTIPIQSKSLMVNDQSSDPIFTSNLGFSISDLEIYQKNLLFGGEAAAYAPLEEDLNFFLLQAECYNMNFDLQNIEMSEYYDPGLIAEVPAYLYDSADYSVVDQSLFIA